MTTRKCSVCKSGEVVWAWQPFGPDDSVKSFMFPGEHYRGFPVIMICDHCKEEIERRGHFIFAYKGEHYMAYPTQNRVEHIANWKELQACAPF